ncbi:cytochrome o ubiquinol oxidase subunit I [Thiotrichales bacterium 19X7-9]|nr:cytochrome o ubiquinol oxidase subunit I [Thiotrichales bacterium 19X7-9]
MLEKFIFGKLSWDSLEFMHETPVLLAFILTVVVGVLVLGSITYFKKWKWLWTEWLCTVDHKKIGIMYIIAALIMLFRGFTDAAMMRSQQALSNGDNYGYLSAQHFDQIFSAHGVIMIFFMAMPLMFGLINLVVPLQIGARDVAFPFLNSLSFWLFAMGAVLVNISLFVGEFAHTGWLAYPPFSELQYSPGVGVDYYLWSLQISGVGTLLSGINFFVTIIKMRCPGMSLMKMPIFTWTALCSMILVIAAFPILTATLGLLYLDRFMGMHFFTNGFGGNMMMYVNLIWAWGHPEVYILVLPAFGVFSEVVATFAQKRLFGYATMVWATFAITFLSFAVWLHHFFTMGSGANVNAFFGIATMVIAIPTGVKIFNWMFTMYRGRILFTSPMLWSIGFLITFTIGGMTGVLLAVPGVDFVLHNSLFLIAHFHNTIIGGVAFGFFAGLTFWFPKAFGFRLHEGWGKAAFWFWFIGFFVAFMPLYVLGGMGMTRRLYHYDNPVWHSLLIVAACGAFLVACGIFCQFAQIILSFKNREKLADETGDPWNGRTLEWSLPSPAPFYNFAHLPTVDSRDMFWEMKERGAAYPQNTKPYEDIHMPKDTPLGFIISAFAAVFGFAMIWHIYWLAIAGFVCMFLSIMCRSFNYNQDYYVKASEVERIERENAQKRANAKYKYHGLNVENKPDSEIHLPLDGATL